MGFLEDLFGGGSISQEDELRREYDFQRMAAERMAHSFEPIDWETILRSQMPFGYTIQQEQDHLRAEVIEWEDVLKRPRKKVESRVIENITGEKAK